MEPRDERLWRLAQKRARFRKSLYGYIVICSFLWGIWLFSGGLKHGSEHYPWPVWVMLGWGVGLGFQYFGAYGGSKDDMAIEEYDKLKGGQP